MFEFEVDGVTYEITHDNLTTLVASGALIGNSIDGYFLNDSHMFSANEVRILLNPSED